MARIPTKFEADVSLRPLSNERFRATDRTAGARAIGEGAQRLGGVLGQFAEEQDRMDAALDNAVAKTLDTEAMGRFNSIRSDFLNQRGLNAGTARPLAEKALTEARAELVAKATTPRMRKMLESVVDGRVQSVMDTFADHTRTQLTAAEDDASVARYGASAESAIAAPTPEERTRNLDTGKAEIASLGARRGWAPDVVAAEQRKYSSGVHTSVARNMIDGDNIDGALSYIRDHGPEMTDGDATRLRTMLKDPLERRQVNDDYAHFAGMGTTGTSRVVDTPGATPSAMFSGIVAIEGGTDRKTGAFLTSPKGAIGPAQVMPTTGPEAAKLAGVAWDEGRFRTDRAYNLQLGQAYWQAQLRTFGDPLKAAAAYNAGPGSAARGTGVRGAVAKATAAGNPDAWREYLPAETKAYVSKFAAGIGTGAAQQGPQRHDLTTELARVDVLADAQGWSLERRDRLKKEVERRANLDEGLLRRQEDDAGRRANDIIDSLPENRLTSMTQLPADIRARLSSSDRMRLEAQVAENNKPREVAANSQTVVNLHQLALLDADAFKTRDLRSDRANMTPAEYDSLSTLQAKMLAKRSSPEEVAHSRIWGTISRFSPDIGLDLGTQNGKPRNEQDRKDSMRLFTMMNNYLTGITGGERQPTDAEIKSAFDNAVMPSAKTNEGWLWNSTTTQPRFRDANAPLNSVAVPRAAADQIRARLRAQGLPSDERAVAGFYRQYGGR